LRIIDGEGWVKLRNDDFSDLPEHYRSRGQNGDSGLPEISDVLMRTIQATMASQPEERMTLDEVMELGPVRRMRVMQGMRAALVEEDVGFLEAILAEQE